MFDECTNDMREMKESINATLRTVWTGHLMSSKFWFSVRTNVNAALFSTIYLIVRLLQVHCVILWSLNAPIILNGIFLYSFITFWNHLNCMLMAMVIIYDIFSTEILHNSASLTFAAEPVFVTNQDGPMNLNVTEGRDAKFRCQADAEPSADVQWYINGEPLDRKPF